MKLRNENVSNQFAHYSEDLVSANDDWTRLQRYQVNLHLIANSTPQQNILLWSSYHNDFHPQLLHLVIGLLRSDSNSTTLIAALKLMLTSIRELSATYRGVIIDPYTSDTQLAAALVQAGFRKFRTCYTCMWSKQQTATIAREARSNAVLLEKTYTLSSIADLTAVQRQQLLQLQYADYAAVHLDNPVRAFDDDLRLWSTMVFDEDLAADVPAVLISRQNGQIAAYVISYQDDAELLLAYFGEQQTGLIQTQILPHLLAVVAGRHWQLSGELDDTNPLAMTIMHAFPSATAVDELVAYQYRFIPNQQV